MRFWSARSSFGQNPKFDAADELWTAAQEYFEWVEDHPLWQEKGFSYQGKISIEKFSKMRAMSVGGLCLFLGISQEAFEQFGVEIEFCVVAKRIKDVIVEQKFAGAAAELLNSALITRDLGLSDKKELSGIDGGAIETSVQETSAHELALKMFALVREGQKELAREQADNSGNAGGEISRRYKSRNEDDGSEIIFEEVVQSENGGMVSE
ncbi:MAG: DNA-packaging protein [Hyphomicrobiales bacterium]|nr:DNA-packaging protein [Hyphomicrobiales bacterium]